MPTITLNVSEIREIDGFRWARSVFLGWGGKVQIASCPFFISSCTNSTRWGVVPLGNVFVDSGAMTDLAVSGSRTYALFSSLNDVSIATCTSGCGQRDNWKISSVFRDPELAEPLVGNVLFTGANDEVGFGYGMVDGTGNHDVFMFWDGKFLPQ